MKPMDLGEAVDRIHEKISPWFEGNEALERAWKLLVASFPRRSESPGKGRMEGMSIDDRWLPPSPHKEKVLRVIREGLGHIVVRGNNVSPLFVSKWGGVMELSSVRWDGKGLAAFCDSSTAGQTRHPDPCAALDELKGLLKDEPESVKTDKDRLNQLIDDLDLMYSNMQRRCEEYERFSADIVHLHQQMEKVSRPDTVQARRKLSEIRTALQASKPEQVHKLAEVVRRIGGDLERCLSKHKDLAVKVGRLYENIKGGREWREGQALYLDGWMRFTDGRYEKSANPLSVETTVNGEET